MTPMGGSISNGDASLLISTSRLGPFDKNCELVLDGNPDTLKPLSTADLDHFYRAIAQNIPFSSFHRSKTEMPKIRRKF